MVALAMAGALAAAAAMIWREYRGARDGVFAHALLLAEADARTDRAVGQRGVAGDHLRGRRRARIVDAGGETPGDAKALLDLTQRQQTAIGREGATVEASDDRLALDR